MVDSALVSLYLLLEEIDAVVKYSRSISFHVKFTHDVSAFRELSQHIFFMGVCVFSWPTEMLIMLLFTHFSSTTQIDYYDIFE